MPDASLTELAGAAGAGALPTLGLWLRAKWSRENKYQKIADDLFDRFKHENEGLRIELERRKASDARVLIIETCFRLVVPELQRLKPASETLKHVGMMLRAIPVEVNGDEWAELLGRVDVATGGSPVGEREGARED
jgi:hypothetical protein